VSDAVSKGPVFNDGGNFVGNSGAESMSLAHQIHQNVVGFLREFFFDVIETKYVLAKKTADGQGTTVGVLGAFNTTNGSRNGGRNGQASKIGHDVKLLALPSQADLDTTVFVKTWQTRASDSAKLTAPL